MAAQGDGTGPDIWRASVAVLDAAVERAYAGRKRISWLEVYAGEKAFRSTGEWLPAATLDAYRTYRVGIKGPLTTPIGGGIRSLNVALRQELDLYVCLRPVQYFSGVPSPVKRPQDVDMVIFRENTEGRVERVVWYGVCCNDGVVADIYAGIEFEAYSQEAKELYSYLQQKGLSRKVRFPSSAAYGIKPISLEGTSRLVAAAVQYALEQGRAAVTIVHKGNIMKYTEGAFAQWAYTVVKEDFRQEVCCV